MNITEEIKKCKEMKWVKKKEMDKKKRRKHLVLIKVMVLIMIISRTNMKKGNLLNTKKQQLEIMN